MRKMWGNEEDVGDMRKMWGHEEDTVEEYVGVQRRKLDPALSMFPVRLPSVNGTPASQLSTPHSGKSPSPSPTSPASLSRRQPEEGQVRGGAGQRRGRSEEGQVRGGAGQRRGRGQVRGGAGQRRGREDEEDEEEEEEEEEAWPSFISPLHSAALWRHHSLHPALYIVLYLPR
ncbi:Serine/threonine-protein kinase DCLK1 [Takifugu flavidus]|uniref:Serine/threonine-protein kinase DCLK1 n=1 Tax=Takifugu flavidus TaxID=433684 RepID=A0A5C6P658_9TELE|nr:Serine/threonine-protein kinase DCLK1 [Takifugu flavidus]